MCFYAYYELICHCSNFMFGYAVLQLDIFAQHSAARGQSIMCDVCNRDTKVTCSCKARAPSLPGLLDITSICPEPKTVSWWWLDSCRSLLPRTVNECLTKQAYSEGTIQITVMTAESPHSSSWKAKAILRFGAWGSPAMFSIWNLNETA